MLIYKYVILFLLLLFNSSSNFRSQTPYRFPGFPVNIDHQRRPTLKPGVPIAADLNNDGNKEIIAVGCDYWAVSQIPYMLHVIKTDGNELQGFPKPYYSTVFDIAVGDINDDSYIDVVIRLMDSIDVVDRTGNHLPGFPVFYQTLQSQSNWVPSNFINLYDLDNDGKIEIITGQYGAMAVFDFQGQLKNGWPRPVVGRVRSNPAIGDLDKDGYAEIVSTQFKERYGQPNIDSPSINILRYNGSEFNINWPKYHDSLYYTFTSSPSIYIGNTSNESFIIFALQKGFVNPIRGNLKYFKCNIYGELLNSVHLVYPVSGLNEVTMSIGDVNRDGTFEYSMSVLADLYLFSSNFTIIQGWPKLGSQGLFLTPAMVKLSYASELNILSSGHFANDSGGFIHAYNKNAEQLNWSPLRPNGINFGLCVTDLNNDGSIEIVTTNAPQDTTFYINVWTVPGITFNHNDFPWPQYCHDRFKSNQYGFIPPDEPIGIEPISTEVPNSFALFQNYPNPFNPVTKIKFTIPLSRGVSEGRGVFTKLVVYDVIGREIAVLLNENLKAGTYKVNWDASNYPSGVYFYKIITGSYTETKKMVLIK